MDTLLNPNLYFVLLVGGLIFSVLAILTPGTGIIEIGGIFALFFAGYGILTTPTNLWALIFLVPFFPLIFVYRKTKSVIALILAIIGLNVGAYTLFKAEPKGFSVSPILGITMAIVDSLIIWFVVKKVIEAIDQSPSYDPQRIIGDIGEARTNVYKEGTVYVGGEEWTAMSDQLISKGSKIKVIDKEGLTLIVEQFANENSGG